MALLDERPTLLQRALLTSKVFDKIFDTFHGDTVSKAQIAKRAKELDVHPDSADECAQFFIESALTSGLGTMNGDSISLVNIAAVAVPSAGNSEGDHAEDAAVAEAQAAAVVTAAAPVKRGASSVVEGSKPGLNVSLNVDSSSDPDKLEKQLKLLREYGVI